MNPWLLFGRVGANLKWYIIIAAATTVVVISLPVMAVFALGNDAVTFLNASPSAVAAEQGGFYMGGPVPGDTYAWGNCTYWAYAMRLWAGNPVSAHWGNANTWDDNARSDGYVVDHIPAVGAVFQTDEGEWGHVAYVINVNANNGEWTISEMNAPHLNVVTQRTFMASAASFYTFIHDKKGAPTWIPQPISPISSHFGQ